MSDASGPGSRAPHEAAGARFPISPKTVTVAGYAPTSPKRALWSGLRWNGKEQLLRQSTLMRSVFGDDAPHDLHLNVPWCHPDDYRTGEDADCRYRVRPRMRPGERWKGRLVKTVAIERDESLTPRWVIVVEFAQTIEAQGAKTQSDSVHESPVAESDASKGTSRAP